jgi:hypothetical protein
MVAYPWPPKDPESQTQLVSDRFGIKGALFWLGAATLIVLSLYLL